MIIDVKAAFFNLIFPQHLELFSEIFSAMQAE